MNFSHGAWHQRKEGLAMNEAAAIILAGGKSSRMGTNKALLKINDKMNVERIRDELRNSFHDIILVTNDPKAYEFLGINMVSDDYPGMGPLAGLHAGLKASARKVNLVVACDMPFVSAKLSRLLVEQYRGGDAVVPVINGKPQPLFAVYKKEIADNAAKCIEHGKRSMNYLLDRLVVHYVTEKDLADFANVDLERFFFNMNEPQDYEAAKKLGLKR